MSLIGLDMQFLDRESSPEEYYQEAQSLEANEVYDSAGQMYRLSGMLGCMDDASRCVYLLMARHGEYLKAADGLWSIGEYRLAYQQYENAENKPGIIRCRLLRGDTWQTIMEECGVGEVEIRKAVFARPNDDLLQAYIRAYLPRIEEVQAD